MSLKELPKLPKQMNLAPSASLFKPQQIINPQTFSVITLDDISVKLTKLIDLETRRLDLEEAILKELQDEADEGQELTQDGTVLNTEFTFIDVGQLRQGLRVKSFELTNDHATNGLFFGWNVTEGGLEPSLDDPASSLTKFRILDAGDSIKIIFNRKVIRNIALLGSGGDATYRLWMVW